MTHMQDEPQGLLWGERTENHSFISMHAAFAMAKRRKPGSWDPVIHEQDRKQNR